MIHRPAPVTPRFTSAAFGTWLGWALLASLAAALATGLMGVLAVGLGSGYYLAGFDERPDHPLHQALRPGGYIGVALGVTGTSLMLAMQLYTVRKWLPPTGWIGSPGWWLRFHILCGLAGPVAIVLHGGLYLPSGLVAIGFWCMVLVSASGTFGRYVYGYFPRSAAGVEIGMRAAAERISDLRVELVELTGGVDADRIGEAVTLARDLDHEAQGVLDLAALDLEVRRRARRIRHLLAGLDLDPAVRRTAADTLVAQLKLKRGIETWQVTQRLFRYWHLFHEPLAKAMYLIAAWHVLEAIVFGGALETLLHWGAK
ncbi:MAG: hypothetical protein ABMA64_14610 [Myxococcota bacterium]